MKMTKTTKIIALSVLAVAFLASGYLYYQHTESDLNKRFVYAKMPITSATSTKEDCSAIPACAKLMKTQQQNYQQDLEKYKKMADDIRSKLRTQTTAKIGEPFTLWDMRYSVVSAADKGSQYGYGNGTSGKYIAVSIDVTNVGKAQAGISNIYLQDSQERRYNLNNLVLGIMPGSDASGRSNYGAYNNFEGIPAGFTEKYMAVFEVPKDSKGVELRFPSSEGTVVKSVTLGF